MKKLLIIPLIVLGLFACQEKDLDVFSSGNRIYFDKYFMNEFVPGTEEADSTTMSFFFFPDGTHTIQASLVVCLSGPLLESDASFKLKVDEDATTANSSEYTIANEYVFHANNIAENADRVLDTINIDLHMSDRLSGLENGVKLVVELIPNDRLGVGQYERTKANIIITTKASKPEWWTKEVTKSLLGEYSQKKYKLFLNNVDTNAEMSLDLIENRADKAIDLALRFKDWLNNQDPAILDEDGSVMTVTI